MTAAHPQLEPLAQGFRERYLRFDELTAQLKAWADAFPDVVHLESIGQSREGRELWLLTLGPEPTRTRPAVWVDANIHAGELAGSSVALAIAEEVIALHLDAPDPARIPGPVHRAAREVLFHVLPRMSPDGAEAVLDTGRYVRSVPRDERFERAHPRWVGEDVDGDGLALLMRQPDSTGEFVEHPEVPGLMLPRTIEDEGPFYKLYPEGRIEHFDGHHVPDPDFLSDNAPDLNRNFPWSWVGEPRQKGAGSHPGSEPESRAVIARAARTPNLFAWLSLHTFGGVMIRPPGDRPDDEMNPRDLALYRQVEEWAARFCDYPMVSGFEEFLYEPGHPVHGSLTEWAYDERGCLAWVTELWDLFQQLELERPERFIDYYFRLTREDLVRLAEWDAKENAGRIFRPWKRHRHPQIGEVEVGGIDPRVGLTNPPYEALPELCDRHARFFVRVAAMCPHVVVSRVAQTPLREELTLLEATVENQGYLPTHGVHASADRPWNEPLWADLICEDGTSLEEPGQAHRLVGHLDGWGRGRFDFGHAIFFQRSKGSVSRRTLRWMVHGRGTVKLEVGSCRTGWIERRIGVGGGE
ncbi:MAG TPA: M14 family metallopeptidase [Sandaracinaceae bacterium LLY-WYZ-13_1]|nr:M14 family metallopeptidase [Sandaracinaceae bacterium LLY-WYZ-13_1]